MTGRALPPVKVLINMWDRTSNADAISRHITRQNPADPYMIKDGGYTRLAIINELWQETQDRRFFEMDCIFYPWTNKVDVLVRHMRENEMRGDMLFIERAIAAVKIRVNLEAEETKPFSTRELAKRITAYGWTIDHVDLNHSFIQMTISTQLSQTFFGLVMAAILLEKFDLNDTQNQLEAEIAQHP